MQASEDVGLPPSDLASLPLVNTPELVAALEQVVKHCQTIAMLGTHFLMFVFLI